MKGKWHRTIRKFTIGLLILLMGCLLVNQALFTHAHVLLDGSLVSHAHPFSKNTDDSRGNTHKHSRFEIILLEQLHVLICSIGVFVLLRALSRTVSFQPGIEYPDLPSPVFISPGRAPPTGM